MEGWEVTEGVKVTLGVKVDVGGIKGVLEAVDVNVRVGEGGCEAVQVGGSVAVEV
jgi:hypothetical protein